MDQNKLWKILKETEIPDHLTCLLRNLYAGQEETITAQTPRFSEQMGLQAGPLGSGSERYFWPAFLAPGKREGLRSLTRARRGAGDARFLIAAGREGAKGLLSPGPRVGRGRGVLF